MQKSFRVFLILVVLFPLAAMSGNLELLDKRADQFKLNRQLVSDLGNSRFASEFAAYGELMDLLDHKKLSAALFNFIEGSLDDPRYARYISCGVALLTFQWRHFPVIRRFNDPPKLLLKDLLKITPQLFSKDARGPVLDFLRQLPFPEYRPLDSKLVSEKWNEYERAVTFFLISDFKKKQKIVSALFADQLQKGKIKTRYRINLPFKLTQREFEKYHASPQALSKWLINYYGREFLRSNPFFALLHGSMNGFEDRHLDPFFKSEGIENEEAKGLLKEVFELFRRSHQTSRKDIARPTGEAMQSQFKAFLIRSAHALINLHVEDVALQKSKILSNVSQSIKPVWIVSSIEPEKFEEKEPRPKDKKVNKPKSEGSPPAEKKSEEVTFFITMTEEAQADFEALTSGSGDVGTAKQVRDTLAKLEKNPRNPGLYSHPIHSLKKINVWSSWVQRSGAGYRVLWTYGPKRGEIIVLGIVPHY